MSFILKVTLSATRPANSAPPELHDMAEKTLCKFAAPSAGNKPDGTHVSMGDGDFDLTTSQITMAQAYSFCGKPQEDARAQLQQFLEICSTESL
jgi:hypothetical protein